MKQKKHFPKPLIQGTPTAFSSARQAWFWFVRCQSSRVEGARVMAGAGDVIRPCDPDDIYNAVKRLHREGILAQAHLQVLEYYGLVERLPDSRRADEARKDILWREALDALEIVLIGRGIVVPGPDIEDDLNENSLKPCPMIWELPPCHM
ncbi:hypothetical protein [Thalassospira sp.]|uniref:hypothetical protein n=1 Tax=Thalassospira sp. TaxID=1912094 RepID=UPI002732580A|nr:hypothetical protein [Thalassospira sp.]MDP2697597.1 hypothetical protein [Thalassospira sp.]